jgi:predicted transcriptional regulator
VFRRDIFIAASDNNGDNDMRRSKLEEYTSILESLASYPLNFKKISYEADIECKKLKKHLDFLILHHLVEKRPFRHKRMVYAITSMGLAVFKTLQAKEYSERLKNILFTRVGEQQIHVYPMETHPNIR